MSRLSSSGAARVMAAAMLLIGGLILRAAADDKTERDTPHGGLAAGFDRFNGLGLVSSVEELTIGRWSIAAWQSLQVRNWDLQVEVGRFVSLNRWRIVQDYADVAVSPPPATTSLMLAVSPPSLRATLSMGVHVPDGPGQRTGFTVGLWLQPVRSLGLGMEAGVPQHPPGLSATFDGEGGAFDWNLNSVRTAWRTQFTPSGSWSFSGSIIQDRFTPPAPGEVRGADWSLWTSGLLLQRTFECRKTAGNGWQARFKIHGGDVTGQAEAYADGTRFSRFGVIEATWQFWQISAGRESKRFGWSAHASHGSGALASAGVVKFWPFTDGLEALLGLRRDVDLQGSVEWWKVGLVGHTALRPFDVGLSVDLYRVRPDVRVFSWQPIIFGMGIADPQTSTLDVRRADLASAQISCAVQISNRLRLSGSARQWIPLSIERGTGTETLTPVQGQVTLEGSGRGAAFGTGLAVALGVSVSW